MFTPSDAAQSLASADPTAVGGDPSQQAAGAPSVQEQGAGFEVKSASVDATIPKDADNPIAVETSSGELKIEPQGVSPRATAGEPVNDGAAVVYANTGKDSDTSVVPTEKGVETFTNIRGDDASEDYSVKVDLPGDEEVRQLDDDTVRIVDPTPDKPSDEELPDPAKPGTAAAEEARSRSVIDAPDPDPAGRSKVEEAVEQAGTKKPEGVLDSEIEQPPPLTEADVEEQQHSPGEPPEGLPAGVPTQDEAAAVGPAATNHATEAQAERKAEADLATAKQLSDGSIAETNDANAVAAASQEVVVANVRAPQSVDAEGDRVDTSLSVEGDVITLHVDHQGEDVAYPDRSRP